MPKYEMVSQGWTPLHVAACHKQHIVQLLATNLDKVQSLLQHSRQDNRQHFALKRLAPNLQCMQTCTFSNLDLDAKCSN